MTEPAGRARALVHTPVPVPAGVKQRLMRGPIGTAWAALRRRQQHRDYVARREHYHEVLRHRGLVYREEDAIAGVRTRLKSRGWTPRAAADGDVHTFAFVPDRGPHRHLLTDLRELGPLTVFDYQAHGYTIGEFRRADRRAFARRAEMNAMVVPALEAAHAARPIDWVFVYANGYELSAATIRAIADRTGIPTVIHCMDDRHSWTGPWLGDHPAGQVGLAGVFDLAWTTSSIACDWYLAEGGRPIYMPEGFDAQAYRPMDLPRDIPVSFVGAAYGYRPAVIASLRRRGVPIETFGRGWPGSGYVDDLIAITNRSQINLGMGGIGYSETFTTLKGRDFDVPGTGGGMYITSFMPDLAHHYEIGREIVCYRSRDEMLEQIRYYLARPEAARAIADAGRARALRDHRWLHRYQRILRILGLLPAAA
jgi:hypothetical protein